MHSAARHPHAPHPCPATCRPDAAGTYHGYMTEIANGCPLGDYSRASQVAHMTAPSPLGPWSREGIALAGFAHNPQAVMAPNGSVLLFHIGKELAPGCLLQCANSTTTNSNTTRGGGGSSSGGGGPGPSCPGMPHATSVAVADSFGGPWTRFPFILGSKPTNPAPYEPFYLPTPFCAMGKKSTLCA